MRVALYARYSNDRQNERSIEDQFAVCRRHAAARGWTVAASFSDAAISGAAMANRPGLLAMLASAGAAAFDRVLVEDTDRLARDREHDAHIFKRLTYAGVIISTLTSDQVTAIESTFKGLMNELYLVNLSQKTSRGMRANAEKGLATGSRLYGYRGQTGGDIAIVEAEAAVIREIFTRFAAGEPGRRIAADLNARAVPSTRGGAWTGVQIIGNRKRGNGVLYTELYAGVKIWNRMTVTKDPDTGRRRPHMHPPEQWKRTAAEHLRIVPQALWDAVQARKTAEIGLTPGQISARRKGVLTGLLKCGCCGASYTRYSKTRLICAAHREKGPAVCANTHMPRRDAVEGRVLNSLRTQLASPEAASAYVKAYHQAYAEAALAERRERAPIERRIAETRRLEERIVDAICEGRATDSMRDRAVALEAERKGLEMRLASIDAEHGDDADAGQPITLHPNAANRYAQIIAQLQDTLATAATDPEARPLIDTVQSLIIRIDLHPDPTAQDGLRIALTGDLAKFLDLPNGAGTPEGSQRSVSRMLVAGGRIELPTCGL